MRLLIYGGCHALILKRLIDELGPAHLHQVDLLINFQLVASGEQFPYERLKDYDVIIYSPIQNKGIYNTTFLDEACAAANVQAIRFPWLEWHGYATGADKAQFWGHHSWYYPDLIAIGRQFDNLQSYIAHVRDAFPPRDYVTQAMAFTTRRLVEQELAFECQVRVSTFINDNFRERRLFLIPDHPTNVLYKNVVDQIEDLLDTRLIESWPSDLPELQPEERTPILPRIVAETGLSFSDSTWRSAIQPLGSMDLNAFLTLHFQAGHCADDRAEGAAGVVLATANRQTWASPVEPAVGRPGPAAVSIFDQVLMRRRPSAAGDTHFIGEVLATLSEYGAPQAAQRRLGGPYRFRTDDWSFRS
ncbi:WcbI family polysaccharide biosynthesis putative acetyltransferase [Methylobacterium fujisawaense]|uniref:WcbI family polysaccharide biosynthesis putative acetyltransferase n=1 Tax=Methylobacterium fujisawaense TaxID=107400 RepID=UPI002F35D8F8